MKKQSTSLRFYQFLLPILLLSAGLLFAGFYSRKMAKPIQNSVPSFSGLAMCGGGTLFDLSEYDSTREAAPLFENMGKYHFAVKTGSETAARYFDQGIKLVYGFNMGEAHRAFSEAEHLDSNFVMAYWGKALALGPNINDPKPDKEREQAAFEAIQKAMQLRHLTNQKEQDLMEALAARFADSTTVNRDSLSKVYAAAMTTLAQRYPNDNEVLTLYADAVMNTTPWDYYDKAGIPRPGIPEAVRALEQVIAADWNHPGAHHLYIHIVEASKTPDRGVASADVLGSLIPASGHLVHMPSHIYIRVGRYSDAEDCNRLAIERDEEYISSCLAQGEYPLGYYPHNIHFLCSAATFQGKSEMAIEAAEKLARRTPEGMANKMVNLQLYLAVPLESYVRFGKWNEILTTPAPADDLQDLKIIWHYARGIAYTRKGRLDRAAGELTALDTLTTSFLKTVREELEKESKGKPVEKRDSIELAKIEDWCIIANAVVKGELLAAQRNYPAAIEALERAVVAEGNLPYSEPANWHQPVRQVLGAVLLEAGQAQKAEQAYREDLALNRNNGWSLFGLYQSLKAQGREAEAKSTLAKFKEAWAEADVELTSSRF
jgi:tetratricopeptide (TPR) repeat protein